MGAECRFQPRRDKSGTGLIQKLSKGRMKFSGCNLWEKRHKADVSLICQSVLVSSKFSHTQKKTII